MENNWQIKQAEFGDLADVARIHVKSWQQTYKGQVPQEYLDGMDVIKRKEKWEEIFQADNADAKNLYLVYDQAKAIGFVNFGCSRDNRLTGYGEIYVVYLLQEAWGKGLGYALFKTAARILRSVDYTKAYVWVLESNQTAINSYLRWGGQMDKILTVNTNIGGKPVVEFAIKFDLREDGA